AAFPISALPLATIESLKDEGNLEISVLDDVYNYSFNHEEETFDNENIRKAFSLAIDREAMIDNITQTEEKPAMGLVPPSIFEENEEGYFEDNDVDQAKEYLEKGLDEIGEDELDTVKVS